MQFTHKWKLSHRLRMISLYIHRQGAVCWRLPSCIAIFEYSGRKGYMCFTFRVYLELAVTGDGEGEAQSEALLREPALYFNDSVALQMEDHTYVLPRKRETTPPNKRKRSDKRGRDKMRVNIGVAYSRWKELLWKNTLETHIL